MDIITGILSAPLYCIGYIIIGFIAGALARRLMGARNANFTSDIILGLIGSFLGAILVRVLGFSQTLDIGLGIGSLITALIGAVIVIAVGRALRGQRIA